MAVVYNSFANSLFWLCQLFVRNLILFCISLLLLKITITDMNSGILMQSIGFLCQILSLPSHYLKSLE